MRRLRELERERDQLQIALLELQLEETRRAAGQMAATLRMGLDLLAPAAALVPTGRAAQLSALLRVDLLQWELVSDDEVPSGMNTINATPEGPQ